MKGLNRLFDTSKIAHKMSLFYMLIAAAALAIIGLISYNASRSYITRQFSNDINIITDVVKFNIEEKIKFYEFTLNALLVNSEINTYLRGDQLNDAGKAESGYRNVVDILTGAMSGNKEINQLVIYSDNENIITDGKFILSEKSAYDLPWYGKTQKEIRGMIPNNDMINGRNEILFVRTVKDATFSAYTNKIGIIVMHIDSNAIFSDVEEYFLKKVDHLYIEDAEGNVVYSSGSGFTGDKIPDTVISEKIRRMKHNEDSFADTHGENIYVFNTIEPNRWRLICISSISKIDGSSKRIANLTIFAGLMGMCFFYITTRFLSKNTYNRLAVLNRKINKVGEGQFEQDMVDDSRDEIGMLSNQLGYTTKQLAMLVEENKRYLNEKKEIDLKFLRSQIKPYMLYNTLSNINWMAIEKKLSDLSEMSVSLAEFYRLSLLIEKNFISLSDELSLSKLYIKLQDLAYPGLLNIVQEIDESIYKLFTMKLTLQPILENAVIHGILPKNSPGTIIIKCTRKSGSLLMEVIDDGVGFESGKESRKAGVSGIGLKSIDERIKIVFGREYGLNISSKPGIGTSITVRVPEIDNERAARLENDFNSVTYLY